MEPKHNENICGSCKHLRSQHSPEFWFCIASKCRCPRFVEAHITTERKVETEKEEVKKEAGGDGDGDGGS